MAISKGHHNAKIICSCVELYFIVCCKVTVSYNLSEWPDL